MTYIQMQNEIIIHVSKKAKNGFLKTEIVKNWNNMIGKSLNMNVFKIENGEILYLSNNDRFEMGLIQIKNTEKWDYANQKVVEKSFLELFTDGNISEDDFLQHIKEITYNLYLKYVVNLENLEKDKNLKEPIGLWKISNEFELVAKKSLYNKMTKQYKEKMDEVIALSGDKQSLINYYTDLLAILKDYENE